MNGRLCAHPNCTEQGQGKYCPEHWEQARTLLPVSPPPPVITPYQCQVPDCDQPARLYAGGWICGKHIDRE